MQLLQIVLSRIEYLFSSTKICIVQESKKPYPCATISSMLGEYVNVQSRFYFLSSELQLFSRFSLASVSTVCDLPIFRFMFLQKRGDLRVLSAGIKRRANRKKSTDIPSKQLWTSTGPQGVTSQNIIATTVRISDKRHIHMHTHTRK
jgi:hypothetical protein